MEVEQKPGENFMPLLSSNPAPVVNYPARNTTNTNNPIINITEINKTNQEQKLLPKTERIVRVLSNEIVTPATYSYAKAKPKLQKNAKVQQQTKLTSETHARSKEVEMNEDYGVPRKIYPNEADDLISEAAVAGNPIFLSKRDEDSVTHIDVSDKDKANWLSLLPLGKQDTANVWLYEEDNKLYGLTTQFIRTRTPLALGYSKRYADEHKLSFNQPVLDLEEALSQQPKKWWCFECRLDMNSATLFLRHMNIFHKKERPVRRKYRCSYCSRNFTRLFTLRRHMERICKKNHDKQTPVTPEPVSKNTDSVFGISQSTEDNRIPSDESFQNYTSALDFSINLFDPDRISNLDLSGSFKSEAEFPPYGLKDNLENNDDYTKFCKGLKNGDSDKNKATRSKDHDLVTCPHCEQSLTKAKKRRHLRECPARRMVCQCGKIFTRKEDFANHVHTSHNTGDSETIKIKEEENKTGEAPYGCTNCKVTFKRRGMLVNHLWRVHNTTSAAVPLERRERHYPCAVCPKIYRSAAKRDRHVKIHHPGARIRAAPIEGERRVYEPAKCVACPRQYVTRAKLLQHVRREHPELVASFKPKTSKTSSKGSKNELSPQKDPTLGFY